MFAGFYITDKGNQYISKALAGKTLVVTKGKYGNGELPEGTSVRSLTDLIAPLADMPVSHQNNIKNTVVTTTQFSNSVNKKILPPFYLMEAGIFGKLKNEDGTDYEDGTETLLFYSYEQIKERADYIPGVLTEFIINWPLTISDSENITVEINESLVYPTLKEFNERTPIVTTAGGTGDSLEVTVTEEGNLKDGQQMMITLTEDLKAYTTISYNGGKEYPIYNSNGTYVTEKQQVAGSVLNVVFDEENECWYIVGGGSVEIATEAEAKLGTDNTKMMTPLRVSNYVDNVLGDVNTILDNINGEVF